VAVEDSAKARVHEAMANAPAGASDAELRAIAERAAKDVYQHSLQENAASQIAAATPAITSLPALPSQETSLVAHGDESVDGDGDDDEAPGGGPTLEPEEGQDGGGPGLGGLLLVGSLLAAGALLVKGVTDAWGIRVMDPTGQSPAWIRTPPPPSVAPAGYHFEMMRTGETVLVRDGYTLT
jgi:hypothetical protein